MFGYGFDENHELCKYCEGALLCMNMTNKEKIDKANGLKPKIPIAKKKQPLQIYFRKPKVVKGKVIVSFELDADWLRKQLGWDKRSGK
jgi:hypothetical protein